MILRVAIMVAELVAGPTIKKTKTAPGDMPALKKANAKGKAQATKTQANAEAKAKTALVLGCSKCRYLKGGCGTCRNPHFIGKRRSR